MGIVLLDHRHDCGIPDHLYMKPKSFPETDHPNSLQTTPVVSSGVPVSPEASPGGSLGDTPGDFPGDPQARPGGYPGRSPGESRGALKPLERGYLFVVLFCRRVWWLE